jgi:hypothetical protein
MADLLLDVQSKAATPSAGQAVIAVNNTTKRIQTVDDAGFARTLGFVNFSTTSQAPTAATPTYITGSNIAIPAGSLQVGSMFRWTISMTKTAAGIAASTFDICFGTAGTTADTARVSFTKPAGTAAADEGLVTITAICRGPVGASGVVVGTFNLTHNLSATGHATVPSVNVVTVSSAFDITTPTNIGVCLTSGASDAITIQLVTAEAWNV